MTIALNIKLHLIYEAKDVNNTYSKIEFKFKYSTIKNHKNITKFELYQKTKSNLRNINL